MDHHYAVTIAGLPKMFVKASSPVEVKTKLRKMLKRPTEDIIDVERVTDADVRKHFRDMLKPDVQNEEHIHHRNTSGALMLLLYGRKR
jgi:hypothetical protein